MKRVPISLHEFARQMREQDVVFAERVAMFEATRGTMDDDALTVTTQANYICCLVSCLPSFGNTFLRQ